MPRSGTSVLNDLLAYFTRQYQLKNRRVVHFESVTLKILSLYET